ncbi:AraC family transcriptional regulator with amidase-like domain [Maricaulis maris]|uniref:AraC family transcriptional regulator with amidase-like domain n=2 Tax=Maricaulis maris TaxID=74318 RepID=A0A495DKC5_9PROT|nr:AraC family transcriptional regulator with amidase-like domain [Maricaulis maris]
MTTNNYISPMTDTRTIYFATFPGAELLDIAGPAAVFTAANQLSGRPLYRVDVIALPSGEIDHGGGLGLTARAIVDIIPGPADTLVVAGGYEAEITRAVADTGLLAGLGRIARQFGRIGSVCSGTFLLAAAGIITDQRVATHWRGAPRLAARFPGLTVDPDALYVRDGDIWTSAGVTTGIDLALAMLEADHGRALKTRVARELVVYAHRPGHQSQFSDVLDAQTRAGDRYGALIDWMQDRLDQPLKVADLAAYCGQTERTFHRRFSAASGMPPARFVETLRMKHGRDLLEAGLAVKQVAGRCGFRSEAAFRTAFRQHFGVAPGQHARMLAV